MEMVQDLRAGDHPEDLEREIIAAPLGEATDPRGPDTDSGFLFAVNDRAGRHGFIFEPVSPVVASAHRFEYEPVVHISHVAYYPL
jgi:hypothetical protein